MNSVAQVLQEASKTNPTLKAALEDHQKLPAHDQVRPIGGPSPIVSEPLKIVLTPEALDKAGINRRYQNITFAEIANRGIPDNLVDQVEQVKKYVNRIDHYAHYGQGIILKGPPGTLKTTLAVAVLREWLDRGNRGLFVTMAGLFDRINVLKTKNKAEWAAYERNLHEIGLLVLDDLGAEDSSPWDIAKLDAIICERYNRAKPTIITTNMNNEEIKAAYNDRIYDRLRSTAVKALVMSGESLR